MTGGLRCAAAMTILGASLAVSASLAGYPLYGGQAIRYAVAAAVLAGLAHVRGLTALRLTIREAGRLVLLAAVGLAGFNVCVIEASRRVSPSLIGAVVGATPVVLALAAPRWRTLAAAVTITLGVAVLHGPRTADVPGLLLCTGVLAAEAGFSLIAVPLLPRLGPLRVSTYACAFAVPLLLVAGAAAPGPLLAVPTAGEALALAYLAVLVTAVAFVLWYGGLERIGPATAGLFAGLLPVTALAGSVLLGFERLTPHAVLGCLLVAAGLLTGLVRSDRHQVEQGVEADEVARVGRVEG